MNRQFQKSINANKQQSQKEMMESKPNRKGERSRVWKNKRTLSHCSPPKDCRNVPDQVETNWRKYSSTISNPNQSAQLIKTITWRETTSMPIQKATSLHIQSAQSFPKKCCVLIEPLMKDFSELQNLKLNEAIYLLNQSLLGFNTLLYRLGSVEVVREHCGINYEGQCRVWTGPQLGQHESTKGLYDIGQIAEKLFEIILETLNIEERKQLKQLKKLITKTNVNGFYSIHSEIRKYINQQNLNIPKTLTNKQLTRKYKSKNPSIKYTSPLKNIMEGNSSTKLALIQSYKAKASSKSKFTGFNFINRSVKNNFSASKHKKLRFQSNIKKIANIPKHINHEETTTSKNEGITVQQFCIEKNQIQKQYEIMIKPTKQDASQQTKDSLSTTELSNSKNEQRSKSDRSFHNFPEELAKEINKLNDHQRFEGKNVVSLVIESMKVSEVIKGNYDFGGLLRQPPKIQEHLDTEPQSHKNVFSLEGSKLEMKVNSLMHSIYMNEHKDQEKYSNQILKQNSWQAKVKWLMRESEDLKESITCGEEVMGQEIRLEKLGRLGREVGKSIIPTNREL